MYTSTAAAEHRRQVASGQGAPPLFKQPPKKRQKLSSAFEAHDFTSQHAKPQMHQDRSAQHFPGSSMTRASPDNSADCQGDSPMDQSTDASDPAHSAVTKGTPGSTSSLRAASHNTPPLLCQGSSGQLGQTPVPDAQPCQPALHSASKASSNAVTPLPYLTATKALHTHPHQEAQTNPSTEEGHSVIAAAVGPSHFEPSDSVKRQLLAAAGGTLDAASLEGLVRPLFGSPPATGQQDLQALLLAAQQQQPIPDASAQPQHAMHSRRASSELVAQDGTGPAQVALKNQSNPIAKPFAVPSEGQLAAVADGAPQQPPPSAQSNLHHDQTELYKAATAHIAAMLQIPFSANLGRVELWQPPPLKLDSPPLSVLELQSIPATRDRAIPHSNPPATLASVSNLVHAQQLPADAQAKLHMLTNPALQKVLNQTCQPDANLDLEALMKAVQVEGADLYAAARDLDCQHSGQPACNQPQVQDNKIQTLAIILSHNSLYEGFGALCANHGNAALMYMHLLAYHS